MEQAPCGEKVGTGEEIQHRKGNSGPELGDGVGKGPQEALWEVEEGQAQVVRRREHHSSCHTEWITRDDISNHVQMIFQRTSANASGRCSNVEINIAST